MTVASACALLLMGCGVPKSDQMPLEGRLRVLAVDSVVRLSDLVDEAFDSACVLHPYQEKVSGAYRQSVSVNKYLDDVGYFPDEGHWSLVVLGMNSIKIYTFKRSKEFDLFASAGVGAGVSIPSNFGLKDCASFGEAAFYKVVVRGRVNLMFGGVR